MVYQICCNKKYSKLHCKFTLCTACFVVKILKLKEVIHNGAYVYNITATNTTTTTPNTSTATSSTSAATATTGITSESDRTTNVNVTTHLTTEPGNGKL